MELEAQIEKCVNDLIALKEGDQIIKDLMEIVSELNSRQMNEWTGDELSRAGAKLAILLINLGQYYAEVRMNYNSAYVFRKFKTNQLYLQMDDKFQGDKRAKAEIKVKGYYEREIYENYRADAIQALYKDIERLVSVIQSRLKMLISEDFATRNKELSE